MGASPIPTKGDMSGATSMAPMITAGELVMRPSVAILHESTIMRKKLNPGEAASVISATACFRCSAGAGCTIFLNHL